MNKLSKHFNEVIFPEIISPALKISFSNTDNEYSRFVGLTSLLNENDYKIKLSNLYEEKREWLKKIYFPKIGICSIDGNSNKENNADGQLLDIHKIAAVLARCILELKPFAFFLDKAENYIKKYNKFSDFNWLSRNYLINYKFAIDVAMLLNLYDAIDKSNRATNCDKNQLIKNFNEFGFDYYKNPILDIEHESFYNSLIINLAINDLNERDFDYLGFATICFQLQQYSALVYQMNKE